MTKFKERLKKAGFIPKEDEYFPGFIILDTCKNNGNREIHFNYHMGVVDKNTNLCPWCFLGIKVPNN